MWALKIKAREKGNLFEERTIRFGVRVYFFSHNFYEEKGKIFFVGSGVVEGGEREKKGFLRDLKRDKKMESFESNGDFFICSYSEKKTSERARAVKVAYNPRLIFLKPALIDENGWEQWEIASNDKKDLDIFIKNAESLKGVEHQIFYLKKSKIDNIMIYSMLPNLTEKQKKAFVLAVGNGYYDYPRKVKLERLAKEMGVSLSTFQFHLAKAEGKLMPFLERGY
ncbi:MAG: helix-turn-helix domain-containing protein [archaeon]